MTEKLEGLEKMKDIYRIKSKIIYLLKSTLLFQYLRHSIKLFKRHTRVYGNKLSFYLTLLKRMRIYGGKDKFKKLLEDIPIMLPEDDNVFLYYIDPYRTVKTAGHMIGNMTIDYGMVLKKYLAELH